MQQREGQTLTAKTNRYFGWPLSFLFHPIVRRLADAEIEIGVETQPQM